MAQQNDWLLHEEIEEIADILMVSGPEFLSDFQTNLLQFNADVHRLVTERLHRMNAHRQGLCNELPNEIRK